MKNGLLVLAFLFTGALAQAEVVVLDEVRDTSVDAASNFVSKAARYSSSSYYTCSFSDELEVRQMAEESATFKCLEAGFDNCVVRQSTIIEDGYLGYQPDFGKNLGYGCIARALVRGN